MTTLERVTEALREARSDHVREQRVAEIVEVRRR